MRNIFVGAALAFAIVSPAFAADHSATPKQLTVVKSAFSEVQTLKDPDSVKLKNVRISKDNVCGEVNAKNSYGAYVGYTTFYGMYFAKDKDGNPVAMIMHIDSDDGDTIAQQMCATNGL
ncbi:hypothetical protein IMW82_05180 [Rhodanobacter sp. B2A1Ga4]|uniref:hypothetical protein n=1 Tax=Rhodanobacter sp. B2A1Ga4 TaxID=2778647 RepID=UPI001B3874BD|nr:hypothetical protein [Rhodanobacter sp. B2A1Ga4]MBQ4854060.1 hypothetical protein [Rhodanobacter sp. B2A1Ga4]